MLCYCCCYRSLVIVKVNPSLIYTYLKLKAFYSQHSISFIFLSHFFNSSINNTVDFFVCRICYIYNIYSQLYYESVREFLVNQETNKFYMVHYNKLVNVNANEKDKNKNPMLFYQSTNKPNMTVSKKYKKWNKKKTISILKLFSQNCMFSLPFLLQNRFHLFEVHKQTFEYALNIQRKIHKNYIKI